MKLITFIFLIGFFSLDKLFYTKPVEEHGQLFVEESKLLDKNGEIIVLKGMCLGWHNWWHKFYNPSVVKWLHRDLGCSVIRLAIGVDSDSGYLKEPEWTKKVIKVVIESAIKENVYVIIDWHTTKIEKDQAKSFFKEMAQNYGKYPHIIYEIYNEPVNETWKDIKAYSIEIISTIRKFDPDNLILVGTPNWSQDVDSVAGDPISGYSNIMYTLHFYATSHTQWLRNKVNYAIDKGLPIFVTECSGSQYNGDGYIDYLQLNKWFSLLNNADISCVIWSVSDKDESSAILKNGVSYNGNWKMNDLTYSGKIAYSFIKDTRNKNKKDILLLTFIILFILILLRLIYRAFTKSYKINS